ncbi:MAG: GTP pyrophosphokinase rsh [Alphaproteobacteria bacterium MarineAlpha5_Bin9]|nr:MAG: GTP pyrophosphokinase rsh [Alphaproteobacteria bacterium MarineAlpha5_Bin9]|tara:strand:+ start:4811 stop:6931 length:2121 start_codon:yes stop_codon:yes gene_type:complete
MNEIIVKELVSKLKEYQKKEDIDKILEAIEFSKKAHTKQYRKSGEPFYYHPIEVAKLLTEIKLDSSSIASGVLHDTVEDTEVSINQIKSIFGSEISSLVAGLTKINKFVLKKNNLKFGENYRKLILATTQDLRVILIKLADRLHNMKTLDYLNDDNKILKISFETQEIYAPLAQRLGIKEWQDQLEDIAFKKINPDARSSIVDRLNYLNQKDENLIENINKILVDLFTEEDISCKVIGRLKTPFSIWNKIKNKEISFEQLSDIMAFRVITNSSRDCYKGLGIIHRKYSYIQERFKDFISTPKTNGYRSLHTTVIGPRNQKIEIQFRSKAMDQIAEFGVAAHWKYKDPILKKDNETKEYKWLYDLLELMENSSSQEELIENSKIKLFQNNVYVFSPKGDIFELPKNATPIDFAYSIHSEIGDKCVGSRINGKPRPLKTILINGDQVEIITSKGATPSPLWERMAVTSRVKSQIRKFMRSKKYYEHVKLGKEILHNSFINEEIEYNEKGIKKVLKNFNCKDINSLYELIGSGSITSSSVLKNIYPELKLNKKHVQNKNLPIKLKGLTLGMSYNLAGCCSPIKGDKIIGIVTAGLGVSIHTIDCETLNSYSDSPERWLDVSWDLEKEMENLHIAKINTTLVNQPGSLGKATTAIAKNNGNISNIRFSNRKSDFFELVIDVEVRDFNHLTNIIAALRLISEVSSVDRIKG